MNFQQHTEVGENFDPRDRNRQVGRDEEGAAAERPLFFSERMSEYVSLVPPAILYVFMLHFTQLGAGARFFLSRVFTWPGKVETGSGNAGGIGWGLCLTGHNSFSYFMNYLFNRPHNMLVIFSNIQ